MNTCDNTLAYQHLKKCLKLFGHPPAQGTTGTWQHVKCETRFFLCADDFGVKHWSKDDADHLCDSVGKKLDTLQIKMELTTVD